MHKWLHLGNKMIDNLPNKVLLKCPECNNETVDYQYVGDPKSRIGYLDMWCTSCLKGVHISRVQIPENAELIPFDAPKEQIINRIPNFKLVEP
jgi:hypothetical protein